MARWLQRPSCWPMRSADPPRRSCALVWQRFVWWHPCSHKLITNHFCCPLTALGLRFWKLDASQLPPGPQNSRPSCVRPARLVLARICCSSLSRVPFLSYPSPQPSTASCIGSNRLDSRRSDPWTMIISLAWPRGTGLLLVTFRPASPAPCLHLLCIPASIRPSLQWI